MEKHTPGPWSVIGAKKCKGERTVPTVISAGEELKFIAYCDDQLFFYKPTDNAANAALIAAAPDLLEACQAYVAAYEAGTGTIHVNDQIRAAIAKALPTSEEAGA